jgi:hypothetical protein
MPLRAQPPQGCASANFATSANPGVCDYFFGVAGCGVAGAELRVGCRSSMVLLPAPALFVAMIESEMDVNIKTTVDTVVAFESSVAEPRGPKAV